MIILEYAKACIWYKLKKPIIVIYNGFYFWALHAEVLLKEILNNKVWDEHTNIHTFF